MMTINGATISTFSASLLDRLFTNHEVVNVSDWLEGSSSPLFMREYTRYKTLGITILINAVDDKTAETKFDALVAALRTSTIKFDDMDKFFACKFEGTAEPEKLKNGAWKVEFELKCYKTYLAEVSNTATAVTTKSIVNTGSEPSEMYITITPTTNLASFTITGLSASPIVINNLIASQPHVIDGYLFRYLKNGANDIGNYGAFAFPVLPKGTTNVGLSSTSATVVFKFYPKFN